MDKIAKRIMTELNLKPFQVENTIELIDEGNTVPFIARYRKEKTGKLDDIVLRDFYKKLTLYRNVEARKKEVLRLIDEQGKLTPGLIKEIEMAESVRELDDIYRPYKPKRKTRATIAIAKGLEPLADHIFKQEIKNKTLTELAKDYINKEKGVNNIEEALQGASDIIAEYISDDKKLRDILRRHIQKNGFLKTKGKNDNSVYEMYYDFEEKLDRIAGHRILAINRGEKEEVLKVKIDIEEENALYLIYKNIIKKDSAFESFLMETVNDSFKRLLFPSLETEIRNMLKENASDSAMTVFSANLKNLLLQPPLKGYRVLGLDPAYRTGCKIGVVDENGAVLATEVIYPTPPQSRVIESRTVLLELIREYKVGVVAIGNGTASKESEIFIADMIKEENLDINYIVVSESGASVYSASETGTEEFPQYDVALRSAISIARRLQDPLAELVKIDPKSIGVGQYQHDMNQKKLEEELGAVVEDCVNSVGVNLNSASASLLSYISGINKKIAKNIIEYREERGAYRNRKELLSVKGLGDKAFEQCAGFLRIPESEMVLDNTSVHPESYKAAEMLLDKLEYSTEDIKDNKIHNIKDKIKSIGIDGLSKSLSIGVPTLMDIADELEKPGRDPRDGLPQIELRRDVADIEDLKPGMVLTGTVRNVATFGAFVDIGVHQDGLVHISQLSNSFVKNPMDVVAVGDIVKVRVLDIDVQKRRISLSMKEVN
jgi:uncharacterized protein